MTIDTDARYRHADYPGIVWRVIGAETMTEYDPWEDDYSETDTGMVIAVMVGDDRRHVVDPGDLTAVDDDAYCHSCGQIGCGHDGRER